MNTLDNTSNTAVFKPGMGIAILLILYTVGIVGILLPIHERFIYLTPFNLLVSLGIMLYFHPHWKSATYWYLVIAYVWGFMAELLGVQTGLLFGDYAYGGVLGPKVWGTPLMIGINWMMLGYAAGILSNTLLGPLHWVLRGTLAALLMVGLDVLIEPVAIAYDFWSWGGGSIPLSNYVGWFLVAFPLECFFAYYHRATRNKVAISLFVLQVLFFGILALTL